MGTDSPRDPTPEEDWLIGVEKCLAFLPPETRDGYIQQILDHTAKFAPLRPIRMATSERGSVAFLMIYPGKLAMVGGIALLVDSIQTRSFETHRSYFVVCAIQFVMKSS